jgi:hypothetical protein
MMELAKINAHAELERIEQSLLRLRAEFVRYKSRLRRASECVQVLLERLARGFPNPETLAIYEETLNYALQDYFQLREQIDWWVETFHQITTLLDEVEKRSVLMDENLLGLD